MQNAMTNYALVASAAANVLMATIWLVYLHMLLSSYRRQHRPKLIIQPPSGRSVRSPFLLVNMSGEAVHVECVLAIVNTPHLSFSREVAGSNDALSPSAGATSLENVIREGPLQPGQGLSLGTMQEVLSPTSNESSVDEKRPVRQPPPERVEMLEIRAVATHGPTDHLIAARRCFRFFGAGESVEVRPIGLRTEQLTHKKDRAMAQSWLRKCYESEV